MQQQLASVVQARGGAQFLEMRVTMWTAKGVGKRAILDQGSGWTLQHVLLCAPALPFSVIVQITQEICAPVRSRVLQLQKNLPRFQRAA